MIKDLTTGKPGVTLWKYSIPMFISVLFQQLYNIADSIIAGRYAGENALAAVGASYPITMIFMAVAIGSSIGCSVVISQLFGARQPGQMKTAISTTLLSGLALSAVLTGIGLSACRFLMRLIKTPENIFADGELYLKIYIGGILFLFVYNLCNGIFNSLGDSKTPLYFLIFSSLGNIVLDYWFVAGFHWGVAGVAWATFTAQGTACILVLITLYLRMKSIKTEDKIPLYSYAMLKRIGLIAIPSILQQSFISVGNIFIQGLTNGYGSSVIAGYSAAIKLNTFTITSFTTLANGVSGFTAQNMGAGKYERIKKGFNAGLLMVLFMAIPFFIAFFFFGGAMIGLFLKEGSSEALDTGITFLKIVSPFYFVISVKLLADGVLRGSGAMKYFMIATFSDLIIRVILSFILSIPLGTNGIWLSWPIGWIMGTALSLFFYLKGKWEIRSKREK